MKKIIASTVVIALLATACTQNQVEEKEEPFSSLNGAVLYEKVKKFVSIGEHRTGTLTDSITAEWLKSELDSIGAKTEFLEFPLKQFSFESGQLTAGEQKTEIFPVWPVKEGLQLSQSALALDGDKLSKISDSKGKLVFTRLKHVHGSASPEIVAQIDPFIKAGAAGILAVTENNTGEIVALNTFKDQRPWDVPVYLIAPKDTATLLTSIEKKISVNVDIKGNVKEAKSRDVIAKIGNGKKYVVISTPISGWFTTGGERGPGIAIWLGLAKWANANKDNFPDYTFVFTGNAGHELNILGAYEFVERAAPKPEETALWIHLGAGVAVRNWKEDNGQWTLSDSVDSKRGIYYAESVAPAFEKAFAGIQAKKTKGTKENQATVKPGGEGILFRESGYTNLVSLAYSHRYHHVKTDDEKATSPALLIELEQALEVFISEQMAKK